MILGGSTNAVLHLIAMAHSVNIKLDIDDFQNVSDRTPFLADIKPSGKYVMEDVFKMGGIPSGLSTQFLFHLFTELTSRSSRFPPQEQADQWRQYDCDRPYARRKFRTVDPSIR